MNKSLIILVALSVFTAPLCAQDLPIRLPHTDLADGKSTVSVDLIDDYFKQYWKQNKIKKPKVVDDHAFARRASLTINGVSTTFEELQSFANDPAKNKRSAFVDKLLKNSRYADYWGFRLRQWILELREVKGQGANFTTLITTLAKPSRITIPGTKLHTTLSPRKVPLNGTGGLTLESTLMAKRMKCQMLRCVYSLVKTLHVHNVMTIPM